MSHVYARSHLDQVLFTIGLVFMSVAAVDYTMGSSQQFVQIPEALQGQINVFGVGMGKYRLLIIVVCGLLTVGLQLILAKTRFGSRLRAAVDDQRVARGLGINVGAVFAVTFAFGSGLAGLGGALGAEILGLDPTFPLKYMIYFLIVVTVGGTSSITGPFLASILLGIADVAGKYYVPKLGAFVIYAIMIVVLIWRPQGLFARSARRGDARWTAIADDVSAYLQAPRALVAARNRVLDFRFRDHLAVSRQISDPERHRDPGAVRAVARSDPRLCRHHLARPGGVFRLCRIFRRPGRQIRPHQRAGARAVAVGPGRGGARLSSPASWCCAAPT